MLTLEDDEEGVADLADREVVGVRQEVELVVRVQDQLERGGQIRRSRVIGDRIAGLQGDDALDIRHGEAEGKGATGRIDLDRLDIVQTGRGGALA